MQKMERSAVDIQKLSQSESPPRKESVLVIDDDFDTLTLQRLVLEMEGFEVFTAQSGEAALEILSEIKEPNLILLDMLMEDMTGVEFLNLLQEKKPQIIQDVPVVFMTGMNTVPDSKAAGMIRKPADRKTFLEAVHHFIEMGHHQPYQH